MNIAITINTDNAAFDGMCTNAEVLIILRSVIDRLERLDLTIEQNRKLYDSNGNPVGYFKVTED
jgi:hypothetical protein